MILIEDKNIVIGEIKYQPNIFNDYKKHFHNHLYLGTINGGKIKVDFANATKIVNAKEIVIFNPYQMHKTTNIDAKDYYTMCIKLQWLSTNISKDFYIDSNIIHNNKLYNLITQTSSINANLESLKYELKRLSRQNKNTKQELGGVAKLTREYILQNIRHEMNLSLIAKDLGYDQSYIIREFKKAYSITPKQFITILRANLAKDDIKESNISSLAIEYGFFDQSHFNKNFKKIFAYPPKKFK